MLGNIKALVVVLAIATTLFHLAKPIALQFMSGEDFSRRRLVWFVLTTVCFTAPNFSLYALVATPMFLWANRRDSNPIALYLWMLHVAPPVDVLIPLPGTGGGLLPLDNSRLLAVCVLLPAAMRYRRNQTEPAAARFGAMEVLLLAFGLLQVTLYTPPDFPNHPVIQDTWLNIMRRVLQFFLDTYLLYYTVARTCQTRRRMVDAAASFCLACGVMAAVAMFEHLRNWLLYTDIISHWANDPHAAFYLVRGGSVRAQVSAGHSIALGNILAVGFGFWLYLKSHVRSAKYRIGVTLVLWSGLYATSSRGAWLGAAIVYFAFLAAGPRAASRLVKGAVLAVVVAGLIMASPLGDRILEMLPSTGEPADIYRHRLAERGWALVLAHPFFGDRFPWPEMEDLRQGEGIIDIVNTYLGVALNYGLVGLFCFVSFILLGMKGVYVRAKKLANSDPDLALLGASLIACIVGILVMIDSNSFALGCEKMFYVLAGLTSAYAMVARSGQHGRTAFSASNTLQN
jgi:hypothetical protein